MSVPDILNVKNNVLPTVDNMEIKTEVLDPISSSVSEVVFQIPKNGILDGGSFVSLAMTVPAGLVDGFGVSNAFLPMTAGIHGMIRSVQLTIGGKVISSTEDYGHYQNMMRQFETPEHRAYVEQVKSGNSLDRFGSIGSGRICPKDLQTVVEANDNTGRLVTPTFIRPTADDATTPVFSVRLSTLIPMMKSMQLPLFAIKEHVYLRIQFNSQTHGTIAGNTYGNMCCFANINGGGAIPADVTVTPSLANIKFYSDHLYYPDAIMDQTLAEIQSQDGKDILYEDLVLTNTQIATAANPTAPAITTSSVERQIAVSGKTVRDIMITQKHTGTSHNLLGKYFSSCSTADDDYNFRINDNRYYDRNIQSPGRKYDELSKILNKPLYVPSQLYSNNADGNKASADGARNQKSVYIGGINTFVLPSTFNTSIIANQLERTSHFIGVDLKTSLNNQLGNGKKIGVKPILLQYNRKNTQDDNSAIEMRIYSNVERIMKLRNGTVLVSS